MSKFIVYQVLPRLFGSYQSQQIENGSIEQNGCGKFSFFTRKALQEIRELGVTHLWYTGIIEHATQTDYSNYGIPCDHPSVVKGKAGSAYAIKDYYDVDPDLAMSVPDRMSEFESLVHLTHREHLKVIIDFVPNHVARMYASDAKPEGVIDLGAMDDSSLAFSTHNNFYYLPGQRFAPRFDTAGYEEFPAKATGNDQFRSDPSIDDWYETVKLNYGVNYFNNKSVCFDPIPDTWLKMRDILLFWASKKVDGFRCDMAEMVPVEFWEWAIAEVKLVYPDVIFIAEVYNPDEYRNYIFKGGFDYLYDKVGLYDTLRAVICSGRSASDISHCWQSLDGIEDHMLNFLENHDEQRIASDFFAGNPWFAVPALVVSATLNRSPFMVYFGQELGEGGMEKEGFSGRDGRTTIFDYWAIESVQKWYNEGAADGGLLNDDQKQLRELYRRILNLIQNEKAILQGDMYDLQYANRGQVGYDPHRQFAYFRQYQEELLLIIANFDPVQRRVQVNIPTEALQFLQLADTTEIRYRDLLKEGSAEQKGVLGSTTPFTVQVDAVSAVILRISKVGV
jgi:glycosidase